MCKNYRRYLNIYNKRDAKAYFNKSSTLIFAGLTSENPDSFSISSIEAFTLTSSVSSSTSCQYRNWCKLPSKEVIMTMLTIPCAFCSAFQDFQFPFIIFSTPDAWKLARHVLFLLVNRIRVSPSNSSNGTDGGGDMGVMRTTEDSTCKSVNWNIEWRLGTRTLGAGLKLFLATFMIWSTLA